MSRLPLFVFQLFLFSLPFQLNTYFWIPEALILGRRVDYLAPSLYFSDLLFLVVFILALFYRRVRPGSRALLVSGLVIGLCLVSLQVTSVPIVTIVVSFKLLEAVLLILLVGGLRPTLSQVLTPLSLATLILVGIALGQFMLQRSLGGIFYLFGERTFTSISPGIAQVIVGGRLLLRPYATFPHPNVLGGFLTVLLPLWWQQLKLRNLPFQYLLFKSALTCGYIGIFLSFSRSAWLVAGLVTCGSLFLSRRRHLALAAGSILLIFVFLELIVGRFSSLSGVDINSISERLRLHEAALTMIKQSPLVGVGLGAFIPMLPQISSPPFLLQPVHSLYVLLTAETGVVGLMFFSLGMTKLLITGKTTHKHWLLLSLGAVLLLGVVDHYFYTLQQGRLVFALIAGLLLL